ncbi:MAG TPA: glycosyltransferase family A protein [Candidatus Saccharimonadales bacterium]|nr:glycosyltransferase family A protein [Candidatus Saccharimonadales bacterium]
MPKVDVLIPTFNRPEALAATITSLAYQTFQDFDVIISNQGDHLELTNDATLQTAARLLEQRGRTITLLDNLPAKGMAHQRQFLLGHATAPYCLFLDDDILLEPYVLRNLLQVLQEQQCGFTGNAVIGLSHKNDKRPKEQVIEFWNGRVQPESITPDSPEWQRHKLHNAANTLHVQEQHDIDPEHPRPYKIAWVGGCVMYDREKLLDSGGFSFWTELPAAHVGEDVLAELRVMQKYGGCGVLPSGAYHQQVKTTITDREVDAPKWLKP